MLGVTFTGRGEVMDMRGLDMPDEAEPGSIRAAERPDLAAWRRRHELRRSNVAQPIPSGRRYRRTDKHRKRSYDA